MPGAETISKKLFDNWVSTIEAEILAQLNEQESVKVEDILLKTEINEETIHLFISKMVEEGKIEIKTVGIK